MVEIKLQHSTIQCSLHQALLKLNSAVSRHQGQQAELIAMQIIEQQPSCIEAWQTLLFVLKQTQQFSRLITFANKACKLMPDCAIFWYLLAMGYRFESQSELAISALTTAINLVPTNAAWRVDLGIMQTETGEFKQAQQSFEQALTIDSTQYSAYWHLIALVRTFSTEQLSQLLQQIESTTGDNNNNPENLPPSLVFAYFALATHFHNIEQYDQAFHWLQTGNRLKRAGIHTNITDKIQLHEKIQHYYQTKNGQKNLTEIKISQQSQPIFIFGLPRSGTTVVEQIISSHTAVTAGDERPWLSQAFELMLRKNNISAQFPACIDELEPSHYAQIAAQYFALSSSLHKTPFFTDKMPLNYLVAGLIADTFKQAKIVLCRRDPLDSIWGCYKQLFSEGNEFSYDLNELTQTYIAHHHLMNLWQQRLADRVFVVYQQQLIEQQQKVTENLLRYLGLPWQESCLHFHKQQRTVHTLSNTQVKQPLSQKFLNQWQPYKNQLNDVIALLNEANIPLSFKGKYWDEC